MAQFKENCSLMWTTFSLNESAGEIVAETTVSVILFNKRPRVRRRALNRWKFKMAEEISNFTSKSGTSSQHLEWIFDISRDV